MNCFDTACQAGIGINSMRLKCKLIIGVFAYLREPLASIPIDQN